MRIQRKDSGRTHWYIDLDAGEERVPGVTSILDAGLPKKALINWAGNATADYALNNWDTLTQLQPAARLAKLARGRYESKDEAANRGTQIHKLGERALNGEAVTVPEPIRPHVQNYVRFMDEFQLRARYIEGLVYSEEYRYCGQFDIIGDLLFPDMPEYDHLERDDDGFVCWCLIDAKSNRSGIFGETGLQLAGYRYATHLQPDPHDPDSAFPMPEIAWTGAVWIRPDGYSLVPVLADEEQHRAFLYARQVGLWDETSRDAVGEPIEPPTSSRWVLVKADEADER